MSRKSKKVDYLPGQHAVNAVAQGSAEDESIAHLFPTVGQMNKKNRGQSAPG